MAVSLEISGGVMRYLMDFSRQVDSGMVLPTVFFFDTSMMGACNVGEMEDPPAILCNCKDLVSHRKLSVFESGRNFVSKLRGTEPFVS